MFNSSRLKLPPLILAALLIGACSGGSDSDDAELQSSSSDSDLPMVSSKVSKRNLSVGDSFAIEISIANMPLSEGGGISLQYDPAVFRVDSVQLDSAWDFASREGTIDNVRGRVSDILFASYDGHRGAVGIAKISATAVGAGSSQILVKGSSVNPFASSGSHLAVQFEDNTIQVNR